MTLVDYIADRVLVDDGCWPWVGPVHPNGYGAAYLAGGGQTTAHRAVWQALRGPIPDGLVLDHRCHNDDESCTLTTACPHRRCCNPTHLEPVSRGLNSSRGRGAPAKNLAKQLCPRGHEYSHTDSRGWRKCAACMRERKTARRRADGAQPSRRGAAECIHGHPFTPENTRMSNGKRQCRACDLIRLRAFNASRPRKPCARCGGPKEPRRRKFCHSCFPPPELVELEASAQ